jgi:hypothetical protein
LVFLHDPSLDDRCSLCREIVHTTFGLTTLEDHDVQIAVGMPVEPPQRCYFSQIQAHTNYALLEGQPFCQTMMYAFPREMALAALRPFQMYVHCVVFDTNFNIMSHFQLKI